LPRLAASPVNQTRSIGPDAAISSKSRSQAAPRQRRSRQGSWVPAPRSWRSERWSRRRRNSGTIAPDYLRVLGRAKSTTHRWAWPRASATSTARPA
jgi:hypothetical protein